ncbi:MAG: amino acid adenylation domain-containing protein [Candidatus Aminicenantes bacterium]|nr:amino acid adenylation domain-containing protein [Candidatus Aminicenantes bacterium]
MSFNAYETSSAQKRLYIIDNLLGNSLLYNENRVWNIEGKLNPTRLKKILEQLSLRHEILRTCFIMKDGEVLQKVYDRIDVDFTYTQKETVDPTPQDIEVLIDHFLKPYDLADAPLWKLELVQWQGNRQSILMDFHHIIADGISMDLFMRELGAFYLGKELPEPEVQYVDFTIWQNDIFKSENIRKQEAYWLKVFEGDIPILELPTDFPRPREADIAGSSVDFELDEDITAGVNQLAARYNTSLYVVLLTVFDILLAKYTNQEDIVVGTPVSGRSHREFKNIIGMFVNTLAMRNRPEFSKTFNEFLSEVSRNAFAAFENQDYQFEMLVEKVTADRQMNRNPLFDVMFALQNFSQDIDLSAGGNEDMRIIPYHYKRRAAKFDLTLQAFEEGRHILFMLDYRTSLFRPETIARLIKHFLNIFHEVTENPGLLLSNIQVISESEREQLLYVFNDTAVEFPVDKTIPQLFEEQVKMSPDHIALVGAAPRGCPVCCPVQLTYRELDENAGRMACVLNEKGIRADNIVGIIADRSIDTIKGILGILKSGGAYLPIDPDYPQERIDYMLKDSGAKLLVSTDNLAKEGEKVRTWEGEVIFLEGLLKLPQSDSYSLTLLPSYLQSSSNLAYNIYTSGTTGKPKGALIDNKNLVNYVRWFREATGLTGKDRTVLTSSFCFDLGYTVIYPSILSGCQFHIIPKELYMSPGDLLAYIIRHRITFLKMTPSLFGVIVASEEFRRENCGDLRLIVLGGEKIKPDDVNRAHEVGPQIKIMNHYGPTETTIGCIAQAIDFGKFGEYKKRPTIGYPIANIKIFILDKTLALTPVGVPGELCVSGAGVGRGYLNRPELTTEKFIDYHHSSFIIYHSKLYRTGDLARWLVDPAAQGAYIIEFMGRIDQQVKIRGFRIETGEIENLLLKHDKIKDAVVLAKEDEEGNRYICAYVVGTDGAAFDKMTSMELSKGLKEYLSGMLPDYMIPSFFVLLETIPVTSQGKVDRKSLPEPGKRSTAAYTAPRDAMDEKLAEIWGEVLNIRRKDQGDRAEGISIDDNFFELGGHSLRAAVLIARIHKELEVVVKMADIFKMPTIRGISDYLRGAVKDVLIPIEPVEKKKYYPLSPAQNRLYLLHQIDPGSTVYNIPLMLPLEGKVDIEKLEVASRGLIIRHESLRTSFHIIGDEPVQRIHDEVEFKIEILGAGIDFFIRPFDLSHAPLCRVGLIKALESKYILVVDMHHIITDGISRDILAREFTALYAGEELPFLRLQYKDYAEWENSDTRKETRKKQEAYWLKEFTGEIPLLRLPMDHARPEVFGFRGDKFTFMINPGVTAEIKKLAGQMKVTLMMFMFSVYKILLSKYSGQEEFVVGTVSAGRRHADLENIIGFFVNMLAIKTRPAMNKTFREYLMEVKEKALNAYENQDYPFEELVDRLGIRRQPGRQPLVDTVFAFYEENRSGPQESQARQAAAGASHFDLMIYITARNDSMSAIFEFSTDLFNKSTIEEFSNSYREILAQVVENLDITLKELKITLPHHLMAARSAFIRDDEDAWEW